MIRQHDGKKVECSAAAAAFVVNVTVTMAVVHTYVCSSVIFAAAVALAVITCNLMQLLLVLLHILLLVEFSRKKILLCSTFYREREIGPLTINYTPRRRRREIHVRTIHAIVFVWSGHISK